MLLQNFSDVLLSCAVEMAKGREMATKGREMAKGRSPSRGERIQGGRPGARVRSAPIGDLKNAQGTAPEMNSKTGTRNDLETEIAVGGTGTETGTARGSGRAPVSTAVIGSGSGRATAAATGRATTASIAAVSYTHLTLPTKA